MATSELIQQQRHILDTFHNAVLQYRKQIAQAKQHLESALERIQAEQAAAEQEAKQVYEQARDRYITTVTAYLLPKNAEEAAKKELREKLLSTTPILTAEAKIDNVALIKSEMYRIGASDPKVAKPAKKKRLWANWLGPLIIILALPLGALMHRIFLSERLLYTISLSERFAGEIGCSMLVIFIILSMLLGQIIEKLRREELVSITSNLSYLTGLYHSYLKLVAHQAQARKVEAQRVYQQSIEQQKHQFLNSVQRLRSTMLDYTILADQTSPPWQSEAWQNWRPGMLALGVVRLGVFTLQPDQLESKSVMIGEIK